MNYFSSMLGRCGPMTFAAVLMVFYLPAQAQAQALVQDAWARPTVQGQTVGGGIFGSMADQPPTGCWQCQRISLSRSNFTPCGWMAT